MIYEYDASKDQCPLPLVKVRLILKKMQQNDCCIVKLADQGSKSDIPKYLDKKGFLYSKKIINTYTLELHIKTGKLL